MKHLFFSLAMGAYLLLIGSDCDKSSVDPTPNTEGQPINTGNQLLGSFKLYSDPELAMGYNASFQSMGYREVTVNKATGIEKEMGPSVFFNNNETTPSNTLDSYSSSADFLQEFYNDGTFRLLSSDIKYVDGTQDLTNSETTSPISKFEYTRDGKYITWDKDGKMQNPSDELQKTVNEFTRNLFKTLFPPEVIKAFIKGNRDYIVERQKKYSEAYYRDNYPKALDVLDFPPASKSTAKSLEDLINVGATIDKVKTDGSHLKIKISADKFTSPALIEGDLSKTSIYYSAIRNLLVSITDVKAELEMDYNANSGIFYSISLRNEKNNSITRILFEPSKELENENPFFGLSPDESLKLLFPTSIRVEIYEFTFDDLAQRIVTTLNYTYHNVKNNLLN